MEEEDASIGYLAEAAELREMLDLRYDDIKSGKVKPIDGEAFFESLRRRESELIKSRE
jgi:hypothetical protein